jgi:Mg2+-importing ATPase
MIVFGLLSTIFDYATFGILVLVLHAGTDQFRTGWFMESVISACMVVLVIRTRKPLFKSKPRRYLLIATLAVVAFTVILPFSPLAQIFGFIGLTSLYLVAVGVIVLLYIIAAEIVKRIFYKRVKF